jgi:hypothetical protein
MEHKMSQDNLYEQDYLGWLEPQKQVLTSGNWEKLDTTHLFEELEGMSRSEHKQLQNRLIVLLLHLFKWKFQPYLQSNSWCLTILEQRAQIEDLLEDSPSLKDTLSQKVSTAYQRAWIKAELETGLVKSNFPQLCPFSEDNTLGPNFWPMPAHDGSDTLVKVKN